MENIITMPHAGSTCRLSGRISFMFFSRQADKIMDPVVQMEKTTRRFVSNEVIN